MANRLGTNDPIYDASRLNTINLASNLGASPVDAITELTGDVTAIGPGSVPATLATVNANVGTFGSGSQVAQVTVNAKGLVTAAANVSIDPAAFDPHNDARYLKLDASNDPLTGDLDVQVDDANALRVLTEATPSWTFPSSAILDTFNRGDEGPPPSANWSNPSGVDGLRVISNVCSTPLENSATAYAMWTPLSTLTDCECYATTVNSASTIGEFYFFARVQDPNNPLDDCYALHVHYDPTPGNSYSEFVFNLGGAPSTNNQVLLDWNLGDQWGLLTENSGVDVVLTAYLNGTAVNTWTDSSESGFAVGCIGLGIGGDDSDPAAYNAVDSFGGGAKVGSLTAQTVFNVNTLTKVTTTERLESTVLSGLSPLIVASNTLVTNLNADLLDGQHASEFAPASHNVLSATHGDTLTASVVRGDVIVGNATPKWSRLALGGISGSVLTRTATDVGWSAGALSFGGAFTLTISGNSTINGSLVGNISGGGTLATGGFTLTVPATGTAALMNYANSGVFGIGATASNVALDVAGTITSADNAFGVYMGGLTLTPATGNQAYFQYVGGGTVATGAANTIGVAAALLCAPILKSGTGTITNTYAVYGQKSTSGTNNYGAYFEGNVGIGITTPTQPLDVVGISLLNGIRISGALAANTIYQQTASAQLAITANGGDVKIGAATSTYHITILGSGNVGYVGIGAGITPVSRLHVSENNATTNAADNILTIAHNTTGTAADGFGGSIALNLESSTTADQAAANLKWLWATATHASRKGRITSAVYDTAERQWLQVDTDGVASTTTITASQAGAYATTAINLTLTSAHHWVKATAACTITLPTAVGITGREYIITATANSVVIDGNASETISGALTVTLNTGDTLQIKSDGANWFIC